MSTEQLLTQYNNENDNVTLAEKALEDARSRRANTLKTFLDNYGPGPHLVTVRRRSSFASRPGAGTLTSSRSPAHASKAADMWMKYRHQFADGPGDWEWWDLGNIPQLEVANEAKEIKIELEEEFMGSEHYRGIVYDLIHDPPIKVLEDSLAEALAEAQRWGARVLKLKAQLGLRK